MKNALVLLATAISCLFGHPACGQCQVDQFGPSADADVPWHPVSVYVNDACKLIRANWNPPCAEDEDPAVVDFIIDNDGKPVDIKLKASSGVQLLDNLALDSISKCISFGPLPKQRKVPLAVELQFATGLPEYFYGPDNLRCMRVVLMVDKEEPVSQELAKYPVDLEEKLVELWKFDPTLVREKDEYFCVYRVKVAADGSIEQCCLLKMPNDRCLSTSRNLKMEEAALALLSANKKLLPLPSGSKSRYLYLSFRAREHIYEKSSIAYKPESPVVKRFSDYAEKLVLSHWRPAPGENLDGGVRLKVILDEKGNVKKLDTVQRSGGKDDINAAKRALNESLPIVPPLLDGSTNRLYLDFEADQDPAAWKVFHRYFKQDLEGYCAVFDSEKTDENVGRKAKGVISARQEK